MYPLWLLPQLMMADYVHFSMPDTVRIMCDQQNRSHSCLDVPYIANYIYENPGLNLDLQGIWIADPSLSYDIVQGEIPTLRFVQVSCRPSPCK